MKTTLEDLLKQIAPLPYSQDKGEVSDAQVRMFDVFDANNLHGYQRKVATAAYLVHCANEMPKLIYAAQALLRADERPPDERNLIEAIAAMGFLRDTLKQATTIEL